MKCLLFIFILLASCQKLSSNDKMEYDKLVGVWRNKIGEHEYELKMAKNGKIIFKKSYERAIIFRVTNFRKGADINNTKPGYESYLLGGKDFSPSLSVNLSPTMDTLDVYFGTLIRAE